MKHLLTLCISALLFACSGDPTKGATAGGNQPANAPTDAHGAKQALGNLTVGAHTFAVDQYGDVKAGAEAAFDLDFKAGAALPATVRAWIGIETGVGSMKARLAKEGEHGMHGHVEVPKTIPEGSRLWIEIEDGQKTARGSLAWK